MAQDLEKIASYVPVLLMRRAQANPALLQAPVLENFPAAVLFADISGFTALTERLGKQGPAGVEELTAHLSTYFGQLTALIHAYGGDVIKFAGDALLALWPATEEPLATVTDYAAQCSLAILSQLQDYTVADIHFTLHIGIAAGDMMGLHVGGVQSRWEFLVAGEPLSQMAQATTSAQAGQACIAPEAWVLIQNQYEGIVLDSQDIRLLSARESLPPRPISVPTWVPEMASFLRCYIPPGILARLDAGQTQWLAELRRVTVMFVQLPGLDYPPVGPLERVQQAVQIMQQAIYQYEGTIRQFIRDDKGSVMIAAFGLPPFAHENDAERALLTALAIQDSLQQMGLKSAIGVTTGWAYCGSVGNDVRCEYAMVGDIVNLSARLMVAAKEGVLCDEATYQAAQGRLLFEKLSTIQVKGKAIPLEVHRLRGQSEPALRSFLGRRSPAEASPLVGRLVEQQLLSQKLQTLVGGKSGMVVIEGEPGIGKSRLVDDLRQQAQQLEITTLMGAGDAIEKSTPYHPWQSVFRQLFRLDSLGNLEARRHQVLSYLAGHKDWLLWVPLLNAVVPLDLPENEITQQMTGKVRAENTRALLVHLLQTAVQSAPTLLILEDAHWLDSASWALALEVTQQVRPLLMVVVTRPLRDRLPPEYPKLLQAPQTQQLSLESLTTADTISLVCQKLGVINLPEPVAHLIRDKAEGNPFFSEELAYALRDSGLIVIDQGICEIAPGVEDLQAFNFPNTIQGLITSRIDRLTPAQQLTLKVASVIGRIFVFGVLRDVHPIEPDKVHLTEYLDTLDTLDLTSLSALEPDLTYLFKHIITQEVAYNLMLFAQRRQLHEAVAQWYEQHYADDLAPFYPALAHHWGHTVKPGQGWSVAVAKSVEYAEKAGEQALRSHSLQEAVRFFGDALALYESVRDFTPTHEPITVLRQARWEKHLGEAYLGLGQLPESRKHLNQALVLLGRPMPVQPFKLAGSLLWQLLRQTCHRLGYIQLRRSVAVDDTLLETARVYDLLAEIYYHANEIVAAIYASLRALNLAERAGPSIELARTYANSCFAAGVIPLHSLAEAYKRRARLVARMVDQPVNAEARVLIVTSAYSIGVGHWAEVQSALGRAVKICDRFGDRHQWGNCQAILAKTAYFQGEFHQGIEIWTKVHTVAQHQGDILQQAWGLNGQAEGLLRLGQIDRAVDLLAASLQLFAQNRDRVSETATHGMLAIGHWYQGEPLLAQQAAEETAQRLAQFSSPNSYYLLEGYAGVAQVYLSLWQARGNLHVANAEIHLARQACRGCQQFARVFPVGQPRSWLCQGWYHWLKGHPQRARKAWFKSLTAAEQLGMPYEQGLAHYELGRHGTEEFRQHHLEKAHELFARLQAAYDLARTEAAIASTSWQGVVTSSTSTTQRD